MAEPIEMIIDGKIISDSQSKEQVEESVEVIQEEIQKANPKKSIMKIAIASLKTLKGTAEFAAAVATLATFIAPF